LLERLCVWLESADFTPQPGLELVYAILKAIVAHVYLAWIHPFGDGSGRTARLMEFQILMVAGVPRGIPVLRLLDVSKGGEVVELVFTSHDGPPLLCTLPARPRAAQSRRSGPIRPQVGGERRCPTRA